MALTRARLCCLVAALAANLLLIGGPGAGNAYACSCAGTSSPEEGLRTSDAVFSGEVVSIDERDVLRSAMPPLGKVIFDVGESWKGVSGDSEVVYGQGPEMSCGIEFEKGETYLVFAYRADGERENPLQTDFCSQTGEASTETARRMLSPPSTALPDTGGHDTTGFSAPTALAATSVLLVLAGALILRGTARPR